MTDAEVQIPQKEVAETTLALPDLEHAKTAARAGIDRLAPHDLRNNSSAPSRVV